MAENQTKPTKVSVAAFIAKVANGQQREDSKELVKLFKELTGKPAKMWGPSIVGFDSYHYVYESGREGDAPLIAFSPRKPELVLYVGPYPGDQGLKAKLGKYKSSKACLYIKKLDDLDRGVLRELATASIAELRKRYAVKTVKP
jgi:hypothetical protein